ncbi:cobalt-zinc-cadmium resistance protein CzcA [Nitrosospira sp. Nl5]|uniref:efflux RND transporter permease subunit n=1 Tax=Nitrosospira sp. Nl5 TaxID=200120 RepID=UPI000887D94D|nr:CusA/CzcA family heavy metal efflux RND transporter [Nitrosospira sp. Nl5]SCY78496.1 cobalt-zinc-cadmium resistance protein CzcA [Nitrosospira sp. Nl5]
MFAAIVRTMLKQRLLVVVVALALCVAGVFAAKSLSVDAFPDVTNIQVIVATVSIGRSPEEIERLVTVPVELAMIGLPGLVEMRAINKSGLSLITLVFTDETDVFFARQLVMERLIEVTPRLIPGITPVLGPVTTGLGEVYQYTIEHPDDGKRALTVAELTERRTIQDWVVRPLLRATRGVAEVNSIGGFVKEYHVLVDPNRLRHYDLTLTAVDRAIANNNANASGNILPLHAEQYLIRGVGLIQTLDDIRNIVLKEMDGVPIYVRDVAEVKFGEEVRQGASVKGGYTESVAGIVMMLAGGNAKEIVGRLKEKIADINERGLLPGGLQIVPFYDRTDLVDAALGTVYSTLMESMVLVVVVLFVFLGNLRTSLVVVSTLVITPLITFMIMNQQGIAANLMSLGGLTIAIGMMVDPTIVVVENVFLRLGQARGTGESKLETIVKATAEVGTPVIFGVIVTVLVFLPLMTLQGMEGKTFSPLAVTIAISLMVALFVSVTLSPVLSHYILKGGSEQDTKIVATLKSVYLRVLDRALASRKITIIIALGALMLAFSLFPLLGKSFIPIMKEGAVTPVIIRVPSISLPKAIELEMEATKLIAAVPGVASVVSKLGRGAEPADPASQNESDPIAALDLEGSGRTQQAIEEDIRKALTVLPGVNIALSQPIAQRVDEMVTGVRSQMAVKIFGDDLEELRKLSEQVARIIKSTRGARDIRLERLSGQQELMIDIDRRAIARHGLNVADVNELIATAIGGKAVTMVFEGERRFVLLLRFPEEFRDDVESIRDQLLRPPGSAGPGGLAARGGVLVPLSAVADIKVVDGPAIISREYAKRRVVIGVNVHDRDIGGFVAELQERTAREVKLPTGYYFVWGGQFENMERAMATLSVIVPITLATIFFLLFMLFNSVKLATLIFLALPFASVGGVVGLFITGEYLSVPASVGFIAVWGISILNGVVLISFIKELREQGLSIPEAARKGCEARFRPVLMTAATTLLGLAPFLAATGLGSEVQKPLAIVVIFGLTTASMMTMVLMPMIYPWFDDPAASKRDEPGEPGESATKEAGSRPGLIARIRARFRKNTPTPGA